MSVTKETLSESMLPGHICVPEPLLRFHPDRDEDVETHPLRGLREFGPFSRSTLGAVADPIRVAVLGPRGAKKEVAKLLRELERPHSPKERKAYLIDFPGFSSVFGTRVVLSNLDAIELAEPALQDAFPHKSILEPITRGIAALHVRRSEFDLIVIYLPERWKDCFSNDVNGVRFDLHDFIKCHAASVGIPTQIIREERAMAYFDRCSVMWRVGIAIYSKAGGVPWVLADMPTETMYIGMGYSVSWDEDGKPRFVTACSQIFGSDGAGFEFIGYGTKNATVEKRDNVFLSKNDMFRVLSRSLDLYQHRNGGRLPASVVVHKSTHYTKEEMDGALEALSRVESVELVQIIQETGWRGVHLDPGRSTQERSLPGYAVMRGTCLPVGKYEALLWTQGNAPSVCRGQNYFKEMKGTPRPLGVRRFAGHGPLSLTCKSVLAFTKMDWNNDALYNRLPVTLDFAGDLSRVVKNMPSFVARPYSIRLFM